MNRISRPTNDDSGPLLTPVACGLCIIVFLGLNFQGSDTSWAAASRWGYLPDSAIWEGAPWALLTSVFVHIEILHIAFNVYWLWILGGCLEQKIGSVRWLLFFIAAAWVSSALQLLFTGNSGIGMSGVGYALFGFGWIARRRMAEFDHVLDDRTVRIFLLWLVACMVLTAFNVMQIANGAHIAGLLFGAATAAVFVLRRQLWLTGPALAALIALSFVPLYWCPLSADWNAHQASEAQKNGRYETAIAYYRQSLQLGQEPDWVWHNLALIYGERGDTQNYAEALRELRKVNAKEAGQVEALFAPPKNPSVKSP